MSVDLGLATPPIPAGLNFSYPQMPLDTYTTGQVMGPFRAPTQKGVRIFLNVDSVTTGNGASATAVLTADAVTGSTDLEGGEGYNTAPDIEVTGDGTGATAHAVLTGDAVSSIVIDTGGTSYTHAEFVFSGGGTKGNIKVGVELAEPASDLRHTLLESAAITTTGKQGPYTVYPGATAAANLTVNAQTGPAFYIRMTHSAAGQWRYNMNVEFLN